ncbi:hypothetical protein [Actinoplanes sp. HUAS TT8]|uniref:hypothetical protein n=1 Tax=Actinoplanes sp. HUAS TT8 TaxID=3447453 RepID=UPI003F51C506
MPELELAYRRLLLAYPRFYRRERGLEILTTLMDAAEPGQTRPSRSEAMHLLLIGLRYRLVPPGWIGAIAAGLVTLWVALVFSGAGALAVFAAQRPEAPRLAALADELAGQPAASTMDASGYRAAEMAYLSRTSGVLSTFGAEGWIGPLPVPDEQQHGYDHLTNAPATVAAAFQRLRGDGWTMGALTTGGVFWAERDGAMIRVAAGYDPAAMSISWFPEEPPGLWAGAIAGFVIGGLLAWAGMTWLAHRLARTSPGTRRRMLLLGLPALIACAVNSFDSVMSVIPLDSGSVLLGTDLMYPLGNQIMNPPASVIIGITLFGVLVVLREAATGNRLQPRPAIDS